MARFEFNQNIHIAVSSEVFAQNRAKKRQPPDVVLAAEFSDGFRGNFNPCSVHIVTLPEFLRPNRHGLLTIRLDCTMTCISTADPSDEARPEEAL